MKNKCIVTPTVKVGNREEVSKLFIELADYSGSRETAKLLWALAQIPEFTENLNLEYDENGEPTFSSFSKAINIDEYLNGQISENGLLKDAGAIDKNGVLIKYSSAKEAIEKAITFNSKNRKISKIATVKKTEDGYIVNLEDKKVSNSEEAEKLVFSRSLNNRLLAILRKAGFDVTINEDSRYAGVFNPLDATVTANGLISVLEIAKGERGELAFPEEFAHLMIEGLWGNPLISRLINTLTPEVVEEILGEEYERYSEQYNGDSLRLQKEAAGKLLAQHIKKLEVPVLLKSLLSRIWNWITDKLSKIHKSEITDAINQANKEAGGIAEYIMNNDVLLNLESILRGEPLYDLTEEANKLKDIALESLRLMSKRLKILSLRTKSGKYNEDDAAAIVELQELIEKKKYEKGCLLFLTEALSQIEDLESKFSRLESRDVRDASSLERIRSASATLRSIKEFSVTYEPIIKKLSTLPFMLKKGEIDVTEANAETIAELASKVLRVMSAVQETYTEKRFDVVYEFLKTYWGEDKIIELGKNKGGTFTLKQIMETASRDINGLDRWINSLSECSDPMLNLISKAVKMAHIRRDGVLIEVAAHIRAAHKKLVNSGVSSTDFMFERDSEGKLTGRIISDIDFARFNKERLEFIDSLKGEGLSEYTIKSRVEHWEAFRLEEVPVEGSKERTEMRPRKDMYGIESVEKRLTSALYEYYKTMMKVKALLEDNIPKRYVNTYNAVQISKNMTLAISDNITNPKKAMSLIKERMKSKFLRRADDTGFGETVEDDESGVLLDFSGNPVEKLPVYYTSPLENTEMLSTDFTAAIMAYAGMAINYGEMNKVIDVLELTRDLVKDREVLQHAGDKKLVETFKVLGKVFKKAYTKPGEGSEIGARLDDYYALVIYDKKKEDEGTIKLGNKQVDRAKTLDAVTAYTGQVGLGFNVFSGLSNVLVGKLLMFFEAVGGEYFNYKNLAIGKKNYYAELPGLLAELGSVQKKNKLALLIEKFDALEEFYSDLQHKGYYKSALGRIIGNTNMFILNHAGEHYLHARTMLAILDAYKVKDGTETKSLYDVMKVEENGGEYSILLKEGVTKLDGSEITEDDLYDLKLKIGRVNLSLNGAFNEDDMGAIKKYALGRMAMLFRQWMPAHYNRRFARPYYDAALDLWREGFYVSLGRFIGNTIKDVARGKFLYSVLKELLTDHEKANIRRAIAEISTFAALTFSIMAIGPERDKKGLWADRMLIYQLKRMKMEVGASAPINTSFLKNIFTIVLSPAATIQSFNNLLDVLEFWNMFHELESGRYKGWSEWSRDVSLIWPIYGQARRVFDLNDEDYLFTMLNK